MDLAHDVVRGERAREHGEPREHRRDERRHRLAEHVTEREQVQEADWCERPRVFRVLRDFAFDGNDVRQDVPVGEHDPLRVRRRPRRENDLDRLARIRGTDVPPRRRGVTRTSDVADRPDRPRCHDAPFDFADHDGARIDDLGDAKHEVG